MFYICIKRVCVVFGLVFAQSFAENVDHFIYDVGLVLENKTNLLSFTYGDDVAVFVLFFGVWFFGLDC